jgi:hypothetical protein
VVYSWLLKAGHTALVAWGRGVVTVAVVAETTGGGGAGGLYSIVALTPSEPSTTVVFAVICVYMQTC